MRPTSITRLVAAALPLAGALTLGLPPSSRAENWQAASVALNRTGLPSAYVSVTNKAGLENLSAITIEAWVYPESFSGIPTIVGNNYVNSYWLGLNAQGQVRFYPKGGVSFESISILPLSQWSHVAATYEQASGTVEIYVNGSLNAAFAGVTGTTGSDAGDLRIGADRQGASADYFWQGCLDEVRIWDVRRTTEIEEDMHLPSPVSDSKVGTRYSRLVASWNFDSYPRGLRSRPGVAVGTVEYPRELRPQLWAGTALSLESAADYVSLGPTLNYSAGVTLGAWVFPTTSGTYQTVLGRDFETSFWLGLGPDLRLRYYPRGGPGAYMDGERALVLNQWSYVAAVYRDGLAQLYVNGEFDAQSTAFTGPILNNGRSVYLGADNYSGGAPDYPFAGQVGMARIVAGPQSLAHVRFNMVSGFSSGSGLDEDGILRATRTFTSESHDASTEPYTVVGPAARYVQSGASMQDNSADPQPGGCEMTSWLPDYFLRFTNRSVIEAPVSFEDSLEIPLAVTVSALKLFVNLEYDAGDEPSGEGDLEVQLFDPGNTGSTGLTVFKSGRTPGRDLYTIFDDGAVATVETGRPPYLACVQPRNPLTSGFAGHSTLGTWRLKVTTNGIPAERCRLNSWGMRLNTVDAVAVAPSVPGTAALALAGAHPFGNRGGLRFTLAQAGRVRLDVLDVAGRRIARIEDGFRPAGTHTVDWRTSSLPSGVYMARLEVAGRPAEVLRVLVVH